MEKYSTMQKVFYEQDAGKWTINNRDPVVGSFDAHNKWEEYEYLFKYIPKELWSNMNVLDFGTGPGRNIAKYSSRFKNIDGVDIAQKNLDNAKIWLKYMGINNNKNLYLCNGINLESIDSNIYDLVMSTICLQHICVYNIRKNYLKEFYRILKKGGYKALQMAFDYTYAVRVSDYYDNTYDAQGTNGCHDVSVKDPKHLQKDLEEIGFVDFNYTIGKVGPGDHHDNWIYFSAKKM